MLDFVNCDIMENAPVVDPWPCGPHPLTPSLWTPYFYPAIGRRASEAQNAGSVPVVLHIGASEFGPDRAMYEPLLNALTAHGILPRLVLVEPQTDLIPILTENAMGLPIAPEGLRVINRAVDPACTGEPLKMYGWSSELQELFTRRVALQGFVSSDRNSPLNGAKGASKDPSNPWRDDWARVCDLPNLTDYVVEMTFQCETASGLLSLAGAEASDIASLIIDAEGLDCRILEAFLGMEGFAPAFIMLEIVMDSCFSNVLWPALQRRGYLLGPTSGGDNIVAVDSRLYRMPVLQGLLQWLKPLVPCSEKLCHPDHFK